MRVFNRILVLKRYPTIVRITPRMFNLWCLCAKIWYWEPDKNGQLAKDRHRLLANHWTASQTWTGRIWNSLTSEVWFCWRDTHDIFYLRHNLMIIVHVSFTLLQHIYFEYFSHKILVIFNSNTDKFSFMTTVRAVDYRTAGGRGVV